MTVKAFFTAAKAFFFHDSLGLFFLTAAKAFSQQQPLTRGSHNHLQPKMLLPSRPEDMAMLGGNRLGRWQTHLGRLRPRADLS